MEVNPESFHPTVAPEIWQRFPEYRALSVVVTGFRLEAAAKAPVPAPVLPAWCDGCIEAWHQAFRQFGSNPKRTAPSFDALIKRFRKDGVMPTISPVVDRYNALSVSYAAPFGGEDIDRYQGSPRLVIADGSETFDTMSSGEPVLEHPDKGEVIWRDNAGITCRRWNWRQCKRTAITDASTNLWFVIDRMPPLSVDDLRRAGVELIESLRGLSPGATGTIQLLEPPEA